MALEGLAEAAYIRLMSETVCAVCDKPEHECDCARYCIICHGQWQIRLCNDGLFYCQDCREACDLSLAARAEGQ